MRNRIVITPSGTCYVLDVQALRAVRITQDGVTYEGWQPGGLCAGTIERGADVDFRVGDVVYSTSVGTYAEFDILPLAISAAVEGAVAAYERERNERFTRVVTASGSCYVFDRKNEFLVRPVHHHEAVKPELLYGRLLDGKVPTVDAKFHFMMEGVKFTSARVVSVSTSAELPSEFSALGYDLD